MPICHTPKIPEWQRNGIPGGDCHSITNKDILNDLKCRFENTSFDLFKTFRVTKHRSQKLEKFAEISLVQSNDFI